MTFEKGYHKTECHRLCSRFLQLCCQNYLILRQQPWCNSLRCDESLQEKYIVFIEEFSRPIRYTCICIYPLVFTAFFSLLRVSDVEISSRLS